MTMRDVLFATDFSSASEPAGRVARELARQWDGTLHVAHVVPPVTDPADASKRLERLGTSLGDGLSVKTALLSGRVARHIIDYARETSVGLIVLGTHGRTGVSRALLGSVAEAVVRLAPCPVLTVPSSAFTAAAPVAGPVAVPVAARPKAHACIVCAREGEDLVCEACRTRIRGEALEHKIEQERPGHRGLPV
jgi:nucleotide-binding universal stress UspA family protein